MSEFDHLCRYLQEQHVLSLCCADNSQLWCANCFYLFDAKTMVFWLMSAPETRHGALMLSNPQVAGTINGQPESVLSIRGVQYRGAIRLLEGAEADEPRSRYQSRFPVAREVHAPLWELKPDELKMTDNTLGFGYKIVWQREPPS